MKHLFWIVPLLAAITVVAVYLDSGGSSSTAESSSARVERGTVVRRATAVGRIEVYYEVPVTASQGGILSRLFVELGQKVAEGEPLAEVRPILTERGLITAERALKQARIGEESALEYKDYKHLASFFTGLFLGEKNLERMYEGASLARQQAEEQMELLKTGSAEIEGRKLDFILRAPTAGHVLDIPNWEGSPVVPSSSYGSGTIIAVLADMDRMVFRGTVDEIDVGKLEEGLTANLRVGALPGVTVAGKVAAIDLKAMERNNAVVFGIRIDVTPPEEVKLRSGYSAVADIEIERRDDVLVLPERVVEFRAGKAYVEVLDGRGRRTEKEIETGLGDGMTVEVVSGLSEGDEVLERIYE